MNTDHGAKYEEFTEAAYRELLDIAKGKYQFCRYGESSDRPHLYWRHDVDVCLRSSVRLAKIESELGLRCTYFLFPRSEFYSIFNQSSRVMIKEIVSCGHDIGLHFDPLFYDTLGGANVLEKHLLRELIWIEEEFDRRASAISFHNYANDVSKMPQADRIFGIPNAYGERLQANYKYVSDSNGLWRFDKLRDVLLADYERLQVLTHPVWWPPEPLPPRRRIQRSIDMAAQDLGESYDLLLSNAGRPNIDD